MLKSELIDAVVIESGLTKTTIKETLVALEQVVKNNTTAGEDTVLGFLTISVETRSARTGRNPSTGESIELPAKNVVKIKPAKSLKDSANGS